MIGIAGPGSTIEETAPRSRSSGRGDWPAWLGLWTLWVVATAVGFAIIRAGSVALGDCFLWLDWVGGSNQVGRLALWGCTAGRVLSEGLGGAVIGLGQWLVLRRNLRRAGWWILLTALAWPALWRGLFWG